MRNGTRRNGLKTKYEALLIFPSELDDEGLDAAVEKVKQEIEKLDGTVEGSSRMGKRAFARLMHKQENGHYVVMNMEFDGTRMDALKQRLKLGTQVFRAQFVKNAAVAV
jgi:small subunit ribosomal protein S6